MDIITAIKQRRSVRTFAPEPLSPSLREHLERFAAETHSPFGGDVTILLRDIDAGSVFHPETYGMISGAKTYFLIAAGADDNSALSAGYRFEQVVLEATRLGLGTCWVGGTFRKSAFNSHVSWPAGESLRAVCPVGVPGRTRFLERAMTSVMGSHRRKPFDSLFYADGFRTPLSASSPLAFPLEMMRLAPSSTNSQPWRATTDSDIVHFYCATSNRYSLIDCGIGLCHFSESASHAGIQGNFRNISDHPEPPQNWRYITSFQTR